MPTQAAARKRCASCQRWSGPRSVSSTPESVDIDSETAVGLCQDGPWNGSERRARSACGHWTLWLEIQPINPSPTDTP